MLRQSHELVAIPQKARAFIANGKTLSPDIRDHSFFLTTKTASHISSGHELRGNTPV